VGTSTTQLATTAFVQGEKVSPAFSGTPTAPTAAAGTSTTQLATTAFVTSSPQFVGIPTAPTAAAGTNSTQLATTEFVQGIRVSPAFSGTPTAPTAVYGNNSVQIATTAFVQGEKVSPAFSGVPTAPTADFGTSNNQIATTAFVKNISGNLGTMSIQNANSVAITGGSIIGITPLTVAVGGTGANTASDARTNLGLGNIATQDSNNVNITGGSIFGLGTPVPIASGGTGANTASGARTNLGLAIGTDVAPIASPAFTGTATAPTAAAGTNTTQLATTAFVQFNGTPTGSMMMWPTVSPPTNWLICNGSAVSRITYSALFSVIGTTFGSGDGSSTFNLPNYTNRVPIGAGSSYSVASQGGSATTTLTTNEMPAHFHSASFTGYTSDTENTNIDHNHNESWAGPNGEPGPTAARLNYFGTQPVTGPMNQNAIHHHAFTPTGRVDIGSTGYGTPFSTLPPYLGIYFIIKT
jgi:hypothetical protein